MDQDDKCPRELSCLLYDAFGGIVCCLLVAFRMHDRTITRKRESNMNCTGKDNYDYYYYLMQWSSSAQQPQVVYNRLTIHLIAL